MHLTVKRQIAMEENTVIKLLRNIFIIIIVISKLESQVQGTSLFMSAVSSQRGLPKDSPEEVRVLFPGGPDQERRQSSC